MTFADFKAAQPATQAQEEQILQYTGMLMEALSMNAPKDYS